MKTDRVLAIVRSLIQTQAEEINQITLETSWSTKEGQALRLCELMLLRAILLQDRLLELEKELVKYRLDRRYKKVS